MQELKLYARNDVMNLVFDVTTKFVDQMLDIYASKDIEPETMALILMTGVRVKSMFKEELNINDEEFTELADKYAKDNL